MISNGGSGDGFALIQSQVAAQQHDQQQNRQSSSVYESPQAIFMPCSNSHSFEERRIPVTQGQEQAVKIGRAVVRFQPSQTNAMFDCKVLSRNHAIMWYNDGQFFIKDTCSSNGTFLNNERLSNSGEESPPRVFYSGDILQFGVEIIDNTKKVASGCVTCIISLINERGEECCRPASITGSLSTNANGNSEEITNNSKAIEKLLNDNDAVSLKYTLVPNDKVFIMDQYLKEARFRENLLGQKLQLLAEQLATAQKALESSWQALINEEHLLSRIEILESQLALYVANNKKSVIKKMKDNKVKEVNDDVSGSGAAINAEKNNGDTSLNSLCEDEIRGEIREIHEDRAKSELVAKNALREAEEQRYETNMRLHDAESGLLNLEEENAFLRQQCQDFESELMRRRLESDKLIGELAKRCIESGELHSELVRNRVDFTKLENELEKQKMECAELLVRLRSFEQQQENFTHDESQEQCENEVVVHEQHQSISAVKSSECIVSKTEAFKSLSNKLTMNSTKEESVSGDDSKLTTVSSKPDQLLENSCAEENELVIERKIRSVIKLGTKVYNNEFNSSNLNNCGNEELPQEVSSDEQTVPSVSFIGEDKDYAGQNNCSCGRSIPRSNKNSSGQSANEIQVLLMSTLPFLIVLFAFLFPVFNFWTTSYESAKKLIPSDDPRASPILNENLREAPGDSLN